VLLDAVVLVLLGLAAFVTLAVYYPSFTQPAGGIVNGWLHAALGLGAYTTPIVALLLPAVALPHRLRRDCWRALAWAVALTLLLALGGGLYPSSGWGGIVGDACANLGYHTLGQFYAVLVVLLAVLAVARLAGRSVILPAAKWLSDRLAQPGGGAGRAVAARGSKPSGAAKTVAAVANGKEAARQARRVEVLQAELAAADAPEGESPLIREAQIPADVPRVAPLLEQAVAPEQADAAGGAAPAVRLLEDAPLPSIVELELIEPPRVPDDFAAVIDAAYPPAPQAAPGRPAATAGWAADPRGQLVLFPSTQAGYELPPLALLRDAPLITGEEQYLEPRARIIERTLRSFSVDAACIGSVIGPRVTRYEVKIGPGINVSRIYSLSDNLALELAVKAVRIEAPIPGMSAVGIEVPNAAPQLITLKSILETPLYQRANHPLTVALGRDIAGSPIIANLAKMPHVLVSGATGSGKSVCLNALIVSLLYRNAPDTLRLILIDPKRVEMTNYADLPHLACPVVHDVGQAQSALKWAVAEMERRYRLLEARRARNIAIYNEQAPAEEQLPFIIVVVDELADLMMLAGQVIEKLVCRIAQLSRAVGIHLIIATQRPDVKVITGTIKANIPSRVAFAVVSQIDSRTILDGGGAEKLLGSGDMLFSPIGENVPLRVQGCFLADDEIDRVVEWCRNQAQAHYDEAITRFALEEGEDAAGGGPGGGRDELFREACDIVQQSGRASTSYLQRRLKIGYNRAARIMEELEDAGTVSPPDAQGNRKVL
jgi:S-DNA-T family DNA segregation ATPase FtsK/SpoIIIE